MNRRIHLRALELTAAAATLAATLTARAEEPSAPAAPPRTSADAAAASAASASSAAASEPSAATSEPGAAARSEPAKPGGDDYYYVDDPERDALPFREGTRVPKGFRLDSKPRVALVAVGASASAALWIISTASAIALDEQPSVEGDPNFDDMYWPMFIPVVGPFVAIGTADASGTGAGILALDGAFQAGGLALMIVGLAAPKLELIPQKGVFVGAGAAPGAGGIHVGGTF
ncbi:MAG TPA: hypothetical protein VL400_08855 [Polyangiaceae bacterium]|nr:hypothetical protein [Polyangiaceae bacterium]